MDLICPLLGSCICNCCAAIFSTRAGAAQVLCSNCSCPHSTSICCACSFSCCNRMYSLRALCWDVTTLSAHITTASSSSTFSALPLGNIAALRHPHHRAACARISLQLCLTGAHRLADQLQPAARHLAGAYRHIARQFVAFSHITHEVLHDAVLQRMETDYHQPASGLHMRHTFWQHPRKLFEFLVEINPYSLKGARRRILPGLTSAYRFTNQLDELPRGVDGFDCARRNNRPCNLLSKPFFAVITYHLRQ